MPPDAFARQQPLAKLCRRLEPMFPGSRHVEHVGLDDSPDINVWNFAKTNGLTILTKDSDFNQIVQFYGHPPKVIWLRCGNVTTTYLLSLLVSREQDIRQFLDDPGSGLLEIY